jgi:hypothetical protein
MIDAAEQSILEAVSRARSVNVRSGFCRGLQVPGRWLYGLPCASELFAGAASLNGPFPEGHALLALGSAG